MNLKKLFQRYSQELFLFFTTLFIRFPFFFRDYIDQDESTFILMGQSIADGHLPYDHLWDLKPPLLFYFFAFIENIFPHSFFAIRFCGVLIIFLSAILLMKIAKYARLKNGFLIAVCYILLSSEFGSLQGVMSEHFAVLFLLLGIFYFLKRKNNLDLLIRGIAFGCAILCKLNYAYAVAALILFYFLFSLKKDVKQSIVYVLLSVTGIVIPFILIAIPYLVSGKTSLFINSVFLAPLEYGRATGYSWMEKLKTTWWVIVLIVLVAYLSIKFSKKENKPVVFAITAILCGTVYTFYSSGIINGHYLVQVYPFLLLLVFGIIIQRTIALNLQWVGVAVFLLSFESLLEYVRLIQSTRNPVEYRPTFEVVSELKKRNLDDNKIFFANYHIGYWLLDEYPLTKSTTHPSNLSRPYLFKYYNDSENSLEELKYIMEDIKPEVIVSESNDLDFFADDSPENLYFKQQIDKDFEIIYRDSVDEIYIWQRESNKTTSPFAN